MNTPQAVKTGGRATIRTVIVRISRKLKATYRLRLGRIHSHLLLALVAGLAPTLARALPQDMTQVSGSVSSKTTGSSMVLNQATPKAILEWKSFGIAGNESMRFVQPSSSSVVLNRVTGGDLSGIYGSLRANGQVFLVNPAGVFFAPGAQVNVGGLVASSLGLSDNSFLSGHYQFEGTGGSVVNQGKLTGGYVVLAAPSVTNSGEIAARNGSVGLLAGSRVTVDPLGGGLVTFSVDAGALSAVVNNSGTITADGGRVAVLASALTDTLPTVINQTGVIRANTIAERNGTIVLSGGDHGVVSVSGSLQARGAEAGSTGGTIKVLGERVGVRGGAALDASGDAGGGTVLVGGNFQGHGPEQNSQATVVARGATIDASATGSGDGGKVIVWSDGTTVFAGKASVRGGAVAGDGGFAEVSGKQNLAYLGTVDARGGPGGQMGTLLLDPANIQIVDNGTAPNLNGDGTTGDDLASPTLAAGTFPGQTSVITDGAVETQLAAANVSLSATNNITVNAGADITSASGNRLTLRSTGGGGTIAINAPISVDGGFTASSVGAGTITANAAITTAGSSVQLSTSGAGTINVNSGITSGGGAIQLLTTGGTVNLASDLNAGAGSATLTGSTRADGARAITATTTTFNGTVDGQPGGAGVDSLTVNGRGVFTAAVGAATPLDSLSVTGTSRIDADVTTTASQTYTGNVTLGGTVALTSTANGNISLNGNVGVTGGPRALTVNTTGATVFGGTVGTAAAPLQSLTTNAGGTTSLDGSVTTVAGQAYGDAVTLTSNATLSSTGNAAITAASIASNGNKLTLDTSGGVTVAGAVTTGAGALTTTIGTGLTAASVTVGGATSLGGNVSTTGAQTYSGTVKLTADVVAASTGGGGISFGAVTGTTAGTESLTVNTAGATTFTGAVGSTTVPLEFLVTDAGGTTSLAGSVTTAGAQAYNDAVTLTGNATLRSTGDVAITAASISAGANNLTLDTDGDVTVGGALGTTTGNLVTTVGTALTAGSISVGGTSSLGANVATTAGSQTYTGNTTLTADVVASAGAAAVTFNGNVTASGAPRALTVNSTGATVFGGTVGAGATALQSLTTNAGGTTSLGGNVTTVAGQSYGDPVTLTGNATLSSTGNAAITAPSIASNGNKLTLDTSGGVTVAGAVTTGAGALTTTIGTGLTAASVTVGGATSLGANVSTTGAQTYSGTVKLTADVVAASSGGSTISFGPVTGTTAGAESLTVNTTGATIFTGAVGSVTVPLEFLTTNAGGTTSLGGSVTTAGAQTYNDAVTLTGNATLSSTGNAAITAPSIAANGNKLTLDTSGGVTVAGAVTTGAGTLTTTIGTGLTAASVTVGGATSLGANVSTTGAQTYSGSVKLTADVVAASSGGSTISFGPVTGTTAGAESLTVNTTGATIFTGAVGSATVPLEFLTTNAGGTTSLGGSVTTAGAQTYNDAVTLTGNATLSSTGNAAITAPSIAATGNNLTLDTSGGVTVAGAVTTGAGNLTTTVGTGLTAASVTVGGATSLGANVSTTGAQTYSGNVKLTADVVAASSGGSTISFGPVTGTTAGAESLTVNTTGATVFTGAVGSTAVPLQFLTTNAGGTTSLGGSVTTAGAQAYGDAVTLTGNATLRSTGDVAITAPSIAAGANTLTLDTGGGVTVAGAVTTGTGGLTTTVGTGLTAASVTVGGATSLGANVTTTGAQSYAGSVKLAADVVATSTGNAAITFGPVTGTTAGAESLTVNTTGATTFTGSVGSTAVPLQFLTTNAGGTTSLGGSVTTAGAQTYGDAVTLTGNAILRSTADAPITAASISAGANNLTLDTNGDVAVAGALASTSGDLTTTVGTDLTAASVSVGGSSSLGGNVTTTGAQSYAGAVTLAADVVTASTGGGRIGFGSTVDGTTRGTEALTVNTTGATVFSGAVGGRVALESLTTNAGGTTSLGGNVTTVGAQVYGDPLTLTGNAILTGSAITAPSLAGGGNNLTLMPTGTANLGTASGVGTLTFEGGTLNGTSYTAGTYQLNGGVVNAPIGAGTLQVGQGTTTLNGTAAAGTVTVQSGRLNLGPTTNRLTGATSVTVASAATLDTGTAAQTFGSGAAPAAVTNSGTLIDGNSLTVGSLAGSGVLRTAAGSTLTSTGALSATNGANVIGAGTTVTAGGALSLTGDFQGPLTVNGGASRVALDDRSVSALTLTEQTNSATAVSVTTAGDLTASIDATASTNTSLTSRGGALVVNRLQVSPSGDLSLNARSNITVDTPSLSPVHALTVTTTSGNVQFNRSSQTNYGGGVGLLATGGVTVNKPASATLNSPGDPLYLHPNTPSIRVNPPQNYYVAGNVNADPFLFAQFTNFSAGQAALDAEVDRFIRLQLRDDAGVLPVENQVLSGGISIDDVVAPLSYPSLLIRLPDCLAQQRAGEGQCPPPSR